MSTSAILDEIKSDDLSQLLTSVRLKTSPGGTTQIPALDAYLVSAAQHHDPLSSLNCGDVIEIQGPPASGKTHFLYLLLINCVLPPVHLSITLGGWGKAGVVFDMDGSFDIVRFNQLLLRRLTRLLSDMQLARSIAQSSLDKIHIFRPASTIQLAVTLAHLPRYHTAQFPVTKIGLVAIDSMSAHYWPDRFAAEYMRAPSSEPGPQSKSPLQHVLTALQSFRLSHGPVTLLTNWGLNLANEGTPNTPNFYKQHLQPFPNPFSNAPRPTSSTVASFTSMLTLTHHITVSKTSLSQLQPGIPVEIAKIEDERCRKEGIEKAEVMGLVRTPRSSDVGRFVFYITEDDVFAR